MPKPIPPHIKRDCQQLAYNRTLESINRICDTFGRDSDILAAVASASMSAAFLMFYCAARLTHEDISAHKLFEIWGETMKESGEFDHMEKGYDVAEEYTKRHP